MDKQNLVKIINNMLRSPWSEHDIKLGKDIKCMPSWMSALREIIPMYQERGWLVEKRVSITARSRHLSLNFKHPKWSKKNK